jgi:hypothetical protein
MILKKKLHMKKHPVDDLFKRRLADLDKKPSDNAWLKIKQNGETRRRVGWIWYAAASVAITFIAGYAVWDIRREDQFSSSEKDRLVATSPAKRRVEEKTEQVMSDPDTVMLTAIEVNASKNNSSNRSGEYRKVPEVTAFEDREIVQNNSDTEVASKALDQTSIAESVETPDLRELKSLIAEPESLAFSNIPPKTDEPAITIVVAVETSDMDVEAKPKSSKLSRMFRQLKNARAGERVDWDEVGFNPKSMVARVDDRLRNKEERGHEKDQNLKQRVNL